jgi:hypothetical protein
VRLSKKAVREQQEPKGWERIQKFLIVRTWLVLTILNIVNLVNYLTGKAFYQRDLLEEARGDESVNLAFVEKTLPFWEWVFKATIILRFAVSFIFLKWPKVIYATYSLCLISVVAMGFLSFQWSSLSERSLYFANYQIALYIFLSVDFKSTLLLNTIALSL